MMSYALPTIPRCVSEDTKVSLMMVVNDLRVCSVELNALTKVSNGEEYYTRLDKIYEKYKDKGIVLDALGVPKNRIKDFKKDDKIRFTF